MLFRVAKCLNIPLNHNYSKDFVLFLIIFFCDLLDHFTLIHLLSVHVIFSLIFNLEPSSAVQGFYIILHLQA